MNVDACSEQALRKAYATIDGDYESVLARMITPERVTKFLKMFAKDGSYDSLEAELAEGNRENAFRASHTLKGTAREIGLVALGDAASDVCEALRPESGASLEAAEKLMPPVRQLYAQAISAIESL